MKRLYLILYLVCLAIPGLAEQISREQALRQAQQFLRQRGLPSSVSLAETQMSRNRAQGKIQPDYYYVFNAGQNQGYVIVSGDDRTPEILGYSLSGSFDINHIPDNMAAWLQGYANQIKYIQDHNLQVVKSAATRSGGKVDVTPFLTSHWDQNSPYSDDCAFTLTGVGTIKAVTGCVATAMSQVMYYYKHPAQTLAEIPAYMVTYNGNIPYTFSAVPAGTTFDWGNMLDSYPVNPKAGTEVQRAAVAKLMSVSGKSVKMLYSNSGSSASNNAVPPALISYFGYDETAVDRQRDYYNDKEWDDIIYQEIASKRPVIYGGSTAKNEGHTFILDGYQGDGYYHVNWGWGQLSTSPDGYFLLSAMVATVEGPGGFSDAYNYSQSAVVGIAHEGKTVSEIPKAATTLLNINGGTDPVTISKDTPFIVNYGIVSRMIKTYDFIFNVGLFKDNVFQNTVGAINIKISGLATNHYNSNMSATVSLSSLAPGNYQIIPVSKEYGTDTWYQNERSAEFFINVEVTSTEIKLSLGKAETEPSTDPQPEVSQADRDEVAGLYSAQKKAIDEKIAALVSINTSLKDIAQVLSQKRDALQALNSKVAAIDEKLKSEYLTAEQKQSYLSQLNALNLQISAQITNYNAAVEEFNAIQSRCSSLYTTLNTLLSTVNTEAAAVSSITTKAALEASKAKVAEITAQQTECNVSDETAKTTALESATAGITVTEVESGLTTLETSIDAAIAVAKQAEQDDKDKEKLEESKKSLQDSYDNLKTDLAAKQLTMTGNENTIAWLETGIQKAQDAIAPVEKKIAEIKESLNNDMLSAEQKEKFQSRLLALDKAKSAYADDLKTLETKLAAVKKANEELKVKLETIANLISTQVEAIKNITTTDELSKAQADREDVEAQLGIISPADVEKDLQSVSVELTNLNLSFNGVTKDLAKMEDEVGMAGKLTKAQEECQTAVNSLDEVIKAHQGYWAVLKEAQDELKAKITEISDVIVALKDQYADIEQKLQELIAKQSSTHAGNDVIANLQERLKLLSDNLTTLESQYQQMSDMIAQLEDHLEPYAALIEKATNARDKIQELLPSATVADDVERMTELADLTANELSTDGANFYYQYVEDYDTVLNILNIYIGNINTVYTEANNLEADIEYETTSIQRVAIDESEVFGRYDMKGNRVDSTYKGMQIIKLKNGKTIKLNVK